MRILLTAVVLLTLLTVAATAQTPGRVVFYADAQGTECELVADSQGLATIYMFLTDGVNQNTISFAAPTPACWTDATWLRDVINPGFLSLGATHNADDVGISITFTQCLSSPIYLGRMEFMASGSEPCCEYKAVPGVFGIEVVDCSYQQWLVPSSPVVINPTDDCSCGAAGVVSNEETTWGKVKALYR